MSGNYEQMNKIVHHGLRRDLDRIGHAAQRPGLSPEQRQAVARRTDWLVRFLHDHHTGEEEAIWPLAVRKRSTLRALVAEMETQHAELSTAADGLRVAADAYAADPAESRRHDLVAALDRMRAACLPHLEYEETVAVPELVTTLDDRDWEQVDRAFRKGVGPTYLGWIAMWLLDDLEPGNATFVRSQLPRPVLAYLTWRYGGPYEREATLAWGGLAGVQG